MGLTAFNRMRRLRAERESEKQSVQPLMFESDSDDTNDGKPQEESASSNDIDGASDLGDTNDERPRRGRPKKQGGE